MKHMDLSKAVERIPHTIQEGFSSFPTGPIIIDEIEHHDAGKVEVTMYYQQFQMDCPDFLLIRGRIKDIDSSFPDNNFELSIPDNWNERFVQLGGGAFDGMLRPTCMAEEQLLLKPVYQGKNAESLIQKGFAVCSCDSGHQLDYRVKLWDGSWATRSHARDMFAYEHIKIMYDTAINLIKAATGQLPEYCYFMGGSEGGREAMQAVQKFSQDYDGVISLFPVINWTLKAIRDSHMADVLEANNGEAWLSSDERTFVKETAAKIAEKHGAATGGIITSISKALEYKEEIREELSKKLSPAQMRGLDEMEKTMISPYPLANEWQEAPGYISTLGYGLAGLYPEEKGSRNGNMLQFGDTVTSAMIMEDEAYNPSCFDLTKNKERILEESERFDATNVNIDNFKKHGGKLLFMHGMADEVVSPLSSVKYYKLLRERYGDELENIVRFYLIPGYGHNEGEFQPDCSLIEILDEWVTTNTAPEKLEIPNMILDSPLPVVEISPIVDVEAI